MPETTPNTADDGREDQEGCSADDVAAPYSTQALFLARTMHSSASFPLLSAKRERVFEHMSRTSSNESRANFHGIQLQFAVLAIASWHHSLPQRNRFSHTVIDAAENRMRKLFPTKSLATEALDAFLSQHAPYVDRADTEAALRQAVITRRAETNRAARRPR